MIQVVAEDVYDMVFTKKKSGRIVDGMTIVDAMRQDLNHLTIDEAEELYNNSMREYESYNRQNCR